VNVIGRVADRYDPAVCLRSLRRQDRASDRSALTASTGFRSNVLHTM
jgi:hypothetical protein